MVSTKARRHIQADQRTRLQLLPTPKQIRQRLRQRPALAQPEDRIHPQCCSTWVGLFSQALQTKPLPVAQMLSGEGLTNRQGTPQRHLNASQVQLPGHHQTITTVVTGSHQDHNATAQ